MRRTFSCGLDKFPMLLSRAAAILSKLSTATNLENLKIPILKNLPVHKLIVGSYTAHALKTIDEKVIKGEKRWQGE